ncbi:MAG: hypothetical protein HFK10_08165 [Clostridia bacterium]|jgi:hypothetical protein|nr:hypothetical protein [Clostridia bacterium]
MKKKLGLGLLLAVLACSVCASAFGAAAQTPATQSVSLKDMVTAVLAEGKDEAGVYGKTVAGDVFDYALGYGEVDATAGRSSSRRTRSARAPAYSKRRSNIRAA